MKSLINKLHSSPLLGSIFHTLDYELANELSDCESVLDVGCGPSSPLRNINNIKYSVGVEAYIPYLNKSKKNKIHTKYISKKIQELDFPENSFDAVIAIEVIEHLSEKDVREFLKKAKKWAKKKVIVTSPNGFIPQREIDNNPLQKHLSGWDYNTMKKLGFKCKGLAGLKFLRDNSDKEKMEDDLTESIRFKPKFFWFMVAAISQCFTYYTPNIAFEFFCVFKNGKE